MGENKYRNIGWYGHTPGHTNPVFLSQTETMGHHNFDARQTTDKLYKAVALSYPDNWLNQTTIITVIYAHTGTGENKYQNIGWYRHIPGRTNPISLSQTGTMGYRNFDV